MITVYNHSSQYIRSTIHSLGIYSLLVIGYWLNAK